MIHITETTTEMSGTPAQLMNDICNAIVALQTQVDRQGADINVRKEVNRAIKQHTANKGD